MKNRGKLETSKGVLFDFGKDYAKNFVGRCETRYSWYALDPKINQDKRNGTGYAIDKTILAYLQLTGEIYND